MKMELYAILSAYERTEDYRTKNNLKQQIFDDLSRRDMTEGEFGQKLTEDRGIQYEKSKVSVSERDKRQIYSEALRESIADNAARILSTRQFAMGNYEGMQTLLDYSCTGQAEKKNQLISDTLLGGNTRQKSLLFNTLTNPLLEVNPAAYVGMTDERLVLEWGELGTKLHQCTLLSKMMKEAADLGIKVSKERERAFHILKKKNALSYKVLASRAGMMANPYYSVVNAEDLSKLKPETLKSVRVPDTGMMDYLKDICDMKEYYRENVKAQVKDRLENMGYSSIRDVRFGDKAGNPYEHKEIMGILLKGKPVYILSEENCLQGVLQVMDKDGFLNPTAEEYPALANSREHAVKPEATAKKESLAAGKPGLAAEKTSPVAKKQPPQSQAAPHL